MTTAIKRRRGTTAEHSTFVGLEGEITIDSTKDTVVVHDGATVGGFPLAKESGSNITAASLGVTGNTTLGDASTDTVTVNGYMGVGGAASSDAGLTLTSNALVGAAQSGLQIRPVGTSSATTSIRAIVGRADTAAASFTVADVMQLYAAGSTKGAGSTITNQHGVYIVDQAQGTNNYGITSLVSSGTNKWNIYASGTAKNLFAGQVVMTNNTTTGGSLYLQSTSPQIGFTDTNSFTDINDIVLVRAGTNNYQVQYYDDSAATTYDLQTMSLTETVFNDSSRDIDFRVESDTNTHALFLRGSDGNVGIGTSSPGYKLQISNTASSTFISVISGTSSTSGLLLGDSDSATIGRVEYDNANNFMTLYTNGSERARIDSSGYLLVNATSAGAINSNNFQAIASAGYISVSHVSGTTSGSVYQRFYYAAGSIGSITQNGTTAVSYNTSSDYRLKNITGPITTSGAYIDSLNPVEGTWKADGSTFVGLIAHEVQEASRTTVATGVKDGEEMQGMDYSSAEIIANLIAEVKSLRQRLAAAGL